jgi:hypothetical protein
MRRYQAPSPRSRAVAVGHSTAESSSPKRHDPRPAYVRRRIRAGQGRRSLADQEPLSGAPVPPISPGRVLLPDQAKFKNVRGDVDGQCQPMAASYYGAASEQVTAPAQDEAQLAFVAIDDDDPPPAQRQSQRAGAVVSRLLAVTLSTSRSRVRLPISSRRLLLRSEGEDRPEEAPCFRADCLRPRPQAVTVVTVTSAVVGLRCAVPLIRGTAELPS